jgi:ABC-type transport system involved in cytochrome c biogenesis ATPase subunit
MRLVKAEISGFGRLEAGTIDLDNKVLAIVGPNEAGKTTLLKALAYISNGASLPVPERSRARRVEDSDEVVRVQFVLDDSDRGAVTDLDLEQAPQSIWLSRRAEGGPILQRIVPQVQKSLEPVTTAPTTLAKLSKSAVGTELQELEPAEGEEVDEVRRSLGDRAAALIDSFLGFADDAEVRTTLAKDLDLIRSIDAEFVQIGFTGVIADVVAEVVEWLDIDEPRSAVTDRLFARVPSILMFEDADRTLASSYTLTNEIAASPPAALANIANMAELPLPELWAAIEIGNEGERETMIHNANLVLRNKFSEAWKQSNLTVDLKIESTVLAVRILQNGTRITSFSERSAGLRMFVALVAFLAAKGTTVPPVLLIDEAETHLHIDAQADLVTTFMTQKQAGKIVYTTHSPACLPPDLGSNIRAVLPDKDHGDRSTIEGSFWHNAAGYSPLMLAMGAGAAAFSAARFVVLAEGASEMLLLPSLVRSAIGATDLEYQVAPGLSEVPTSLYLELGLEGARVAYLVDGDAGGLARRAALIKGGVPEFRIVTLDSLTLENLLDPVAYLSVVDLLVRECNPGSTVPALPSLPNPAAELWPAVLELWAKEHGLKLPGKRVIASRLVEEGQARSSDGGKLALKNAHKTIMKILKA